MNNFDIKYSDGSVDKIKRFKRNALKDVIILQQEILYYFFKNQANIGATLAEDEVWSAICKLAKILPVVGVEEVGINIELLEDDIEQLTNIFLTTSVPNEDGQFPTVTKLLENDSWYEPSLISKLNQLNYRGDSGEAIKKLNPEAFQ